MNDNTKRLYFIDAMRAWAILMMLQGHFIDGLLDNSFRDSNNFIYNIWLYFRGVTAPVFFTLSGFIFTFLLIRSEKKVFDNPRVKKGFKRGLQLLFIGYLLRIDLFGLLNGDIYDGFYLVDVLHCIGFSILGIIGIYILTQGKRIFLFSLLLLTASCLLFIFEPYYKEWSYNFLPMAIANYFTKANGSVFTVFPWFGYASFGGFLSVIFIRYKDYKYIYTINIALFTIIGLALIFYSSDVFLVLNKLTGIHIFYEAYRYDYLFARLGDVLVVFSIFMLFRRFLTNRTIIKVGQSTLSIYVIHFIILYGSFTGMGLYRFLNHSLSPAFVITGSILFIVVCSYSALLYERYKTSIKTTLNSAIKQLWKK